MPRTLGGLFGFLVFATAAFVAGGFIWTKLIGPLVGNVMKKAA